MHFQIRRKAQAIALGAALIVTQCCCCIWPIRVRVDQNTPPASVSVQASAAVEEATLENALKTGLDLYWEKFTGFFDSLHP